MEEETKEYIARIVTEVLCKKGHDKKAYMVPIGISARHVHLTQEHVEILFGKGYELTRKKD